MVTLIEAIKKSDIIEIKKTLATEQAKEELLSIDRSGVTPIMYAAKKKSNEILKILLQYIADNNIAINLDNTSGDTRMTALHYAAKSGNDPCVELLLSTNKVNPNIGDTYGRTPLMLAVQNDHLACVQLLAPVSDLTLYSFLDGKKSVFDLAEEVNDEKIKKCLQEYSKLTNR